MQDDRKRRILRGPEELGQVRALVPHDQQSGHDAAVELAAAEITLWRLDADRPQLDLVATRRSRQAEAKHEAHGHQCANAHDGVPPRGPSIVSRTFDASILGSTGFDRNASPSSSTPW